MTTKKAKFECPECSNTFPTARGLGSHRLIKHGVPGSGHSAMERRKRQGRIITLPPAVPVTAGKFQCPDCDASFDRGASLGNHRRGKHGIPGTSANAIKTRAELQAFARPELRCPACGFVARSVNGLRVHQSIRHDVVSDKKDAIRRREERVEKRRNTIAKPTQAIAIAETNGNLGRTEEAHPAAGGYTIPDATLAVALGRFQGLCASISFEFNLPPRDFASRLAELIYHSQVR